MPICNLSPGGVSLAAGGRHPSKRVQRLCLLHGQGGGRTGGAARVPFTGLDRIAGSEGVHLERPDRWDRNAAARPGESVAGSVGGILPGIRVLLRLFLEAGWGREDQRGLRGPWG